MGVLSFPIICISGDQMFNESEVDWENRTMLMVSQTDLRANRNYIQYYILVTNFIFMGIIPSIIMIIFNVLVVRAVNEANQRRARMTRRQQRNITVTSMLVRACVIHIWPSSDPYLCAGHCCGRVPDLPLGEADYQCFRSLRFGEAKRGRESCS